MQLRHSYLYLDVGYIAMEDDEGCYHAFFFSGKDEARRVVSEHAKDDPNSVVMLDDINRAPMLDVAPKTTLALEGTFVATIGRMLTYAAQVADGQIMAITSQLPTGVCALFTSEHPSIRDGMIGYVDDKHEPHLVVFYSKEQGEQLVDSMRGWVPKEDRRRVKKQINSSSLPKRSSRQMVDIGGGIAGYCISSYLMEQSMMSAPDN